MTKWIIFIGIGLLVIFFGPFNIWWNLVLLLGVGLFIIGMAAFVIYATSSAMDFVHNVDRKRNKELSND